MLRLLSRLYAVVVKAYPRQFRRGFGAELRTV